MQKLLTFFSKKKKKKNSVYAVFNSLNVSSKFNDTLINDIVSLEQLGPDFWISSVDLNVVFT